MSDVTAIYMGPKDGKFAVNVKPTNVPEGNLGGAGVVKLFDNEADAQAFVAAINNNNLAQPKEDAFVKSAS